MEPIMIFGIVLQQAMLAVIKKKEKKEKINDTTPEVSTIIEIAKNTSLAAEVLTKSKVAASINEIAFSPVFELANATADILIDIGRDRKAKREFNEFIVEKLRSSSMNEDIKWVCPRYKGIVEARIRRDDIKIKCPCLLNKPPLGCQITWSKMALSSLAFPPLIFLQLFKAFFDFGAISLGVSPMKTYGYCCFADFIINRSISN